MEAIEATRATYRLTEQFDRRMSQTWCVPMVTLDFQLEPEPKGTVLDPATGDKIGVGDIAYFCVDFWLN